jgi:hypothetical protein
MVHPILKTDKTIGSSTYFVELVGSVGLVVCSRFWFGFPVILVERMMYSSLKNMSKTFFGRNPTFWSWLS